MNEAAITTLPPEFLALSLVAALTGILWIPIILNRLAEMGAWKALRNPEPDVRPEADWAYRLSCAHRNAIENLVVFAPLAIIVTLTGATSNLTAAACWIFLFSRLAHALIYSFGIPLFRTIAFAVGFACQAVLFLIIVGLV